MSRSRHGMRRKFVAVLTAFALTFSMAAPAFAAPASQNGEDGEIKYVSLGDSMTNGYGFVGYEQGEDSHVINADSGVSYGDAAYPSKFAAELAEMTGMPVDHTQLAVSGMRAEELNYLLGGREMPTDVWGMNQLHHYSGTENDAELKGIFQNAITDADVITMGIGNASFGAYSVQYFTNMMGVMGGSLSEEEKVDLEEALATLDPDQKAAIVEAYDKMLAEAAKYDSAGIAQSEELQGFIDLMTYVSVSFILNYEGALDQIIALNPDAEIVLIGLMNTAYGMEITGEGFDPVPVGDIVGILFDAMNAYIAGLPTVKQAAGEWTDAKFYYAEYAEPEFIVQVFDDMANAGWPAEGYEGLDSATVRSRTIEAYNDALREMIGMALGMNLPAITIDDVENYVFDTSEKDQYNITIRFFEEAAQYDGTNASELPLVKRYVDQTGDAYLADAGENFSTVFAADIEKEISIAIYLAIEESLAESVDTMEISLEGLMGIAGDVFGALGEMPAGLNPANNPGPYTIKTELVNWFTGSDTGKAMCKIFAMFKVGNGMSVHPTPNSHAVLAETVTNVYKDGYTAKDQTIKNLREALEALEGLVAEYYDEALAYGYQYAKDNGYVDVVVAALDELNAELQGMNLWVVDNGDQIPTEVKSELIAEIEATIASVDALKAFITQTDATEPVVAPDEYAVASVDAFELEVVAAGADDAAVLICDIETHLANIDALIKAAADDLGEAALAELADMANAACAKLQAAKPAVEQCAAEKFEAAAEFILEKLGEVYEALAQAAYEAAEKYGPEAAEWIYSWILENPEAIIEFVVEYGPEAVEFVGQYEEEIFSVLGWLAENYGDDVVGFVVENPEYLEAMVDFVVEYGDEAWELIKAFADASGLTAAVEAEIADLEVELEALNAQISSEFGAVDAAVKADVQKQIALIEVELGKLEALVDQAGAAVATGAEGVDALIAEIEATVDEINAAALELEATVQGVNAELEAAVAQVVAAVEAVDAAVDGLVAVGKDAQALFAQIVSFIEQFDAEAIIGGYVAEAVEAATTGEYEITKMSRYAAIGDATIAGENSYADQFAAELAATAEAEGGHFNPDLQYDKLVVANEDGSAATAADILTKIESGEWNEAIANADIITVSLGSEDLTISAKDKLLEIVFAYVNSMLAGEAYESVDASDWAYYVGEDGAAQIDAAVELIYAELAKTIGDEAAAQMATDAIEGYVYSYVGFATSYADVINAIQALNPEAEIVVIGLNNVLDGLVLNFGNVEVDLGEYADYIFKSADLQLLAYAVQDAEGNVTFVSAPEADSDIAGVISEMAALLATVDFNKVLEDSDTALEIIAMIGSANMTSTWMPNADGQSYIFDKIMDAMTITVNPEGAEPEEPGVVEYTLTLTEGEGFTYFVECQDEASFKVAEGTEVELWVEPADGWKVNAVYANGAQAACSEEAANLYVLVINEDTVITVDAEMLPTTLERIWGDYANQTSVKIADKAFDSSEWVVISRDDDFRDAMSASGLAGALEAPIILTDRDGLSNAAREQIEELDAKYAYIIGGPGAMPGDFEAELAAMGLEKVERVFGNQSYDTSVECAKRIAQLNEENGWRPEGAIVAYGQNFQDALSMSSFAYKYHVPIFLQTFGATSADRGLTDEAVELINSEFFGTLFIAGGTGAVSDESLEGIILNDSVRLGGEDGYDTSLEIAKFMVSENPLTGEPYLNPETVAVCCGALEANGLDALSGSALIGKDAGVILLATSQENYGSTHMEAVDGFFSEYAGDVKTAYILGGQYVMPTDIFNAVADYLSLAHELI